MRKTAHKAVSNLREKAIDDIIEISDDFAVISTKAKRINRNGKKVGGEYAVAMDKNLLAVDLLKFILEDTKDDITGIVVFTKKK